MQGEGVVRAHVENDATAPAVKVVDDFIGDWQGVLRPLFLGADDTEGGAIGLWDKTGQGRIINLK